MFVTNQVVITTVLVALNAKSQQALSAARRGIETDAGNGCGGSTWARDTLKMMMRTFAARRSGDPIGLVIMAPGWEADWQQKPLWPRLAHATAIKKADDQATTIATRAFRSGRSFLSSNRAVSLP